MPSYVSKPGLEGRVLPIESLSSVSRVEVETLARVWVPTCREIPSAAVVEKQEEDTSWRWGGVTGWGHRYVVEIKKSVKEIKKSKWK